VCLAFFIDIIVYEGIPSLQLNLRAWCVCELRVLLFLSLSLCRLRRNTLASLESACGERGGEEGGGRGNLRREGGREWVWVCWQRKEKKKGEMEKDVTQALAAALLWP